MPISKENRKRYPPNWQEISGVCRVRAAGCCEWCGAAQGQPHPRTGSKVVLTTAHLDHQPENNALDNLRVLCQRCHNRYDAPQRAMNRAHTRAARKAIEQRDLFEDSHPRP